MTRQTDLTPQLLVLIALLDRISTRHMEIGWYLINDKSNGQMEEKAS